MDKLLNTREASEITGYSIRHVRYLVNRGELKAIRIKAGSELRFLKEDLMSLTHTPEQFPKVKDPGK